MRRISTKALAFLAVLILLILTFPAAESKAQGIENVAVSYFLGSSPFTLHEPIILEFLVKNNSGQPVELDLGNDRKGNFRFTITRPDGTRVPLPPFFREGFTRAGRLVVEPGLEHKEQLVLNEWFGFGVDGTYELEVRLIQPVKTKDGAVLVEVAPFHARLKILRRDPARLEEVCASLTRQIYGASSSEAAIDAALALSYVRDPVAVPFLEKALRARRLVEGLAIDGLRRVGNQEAIQVLISALGRGEWETWTDVQQLAGAALGMISFETADPVVKENIQRALQKAKEKKPESIP